MAEIKEVKDLNTIAGIRRATQESIRPVIEEIQRKMAGLSQQNQQLAAKTQYLLDLQKRLVRSEQTARYLQSQLLQVREECQNMQLQQAKERDEAARFQEKITEDIRKMLRHKQKQDAIMQSTNDRTQKMSGQLAMTMGLIKKREELMQNRFMSLNQKAESLSFEIRQTSAQLQKQFNSISAVLNSEQKNNQKRLKLLDEYEMERDLLAKKMNDLTQAMSQTVKRKDYAEYKQSLKKDQERFVGSIKQMIQANLSETTKTLLTELPQMKEQLKHCLSFENMIQSNQTKIVAICDTVQLNHIEHAKTVADLKVQLQNQFNFIEEQRRTMKVDIQKCLKFQVFLQEKLDKYSEQLKQEMRAENYKKSRELYEEIRIAFADKKEELREKQLAKIVQQRLRLTDKCLQIQILGGKIGEVLTNFSTKFTRIKSDNEIFIDTVNRQMGEVHQLHKTIRDNASKIGSVIGQLTETILLTSCIQIQGQAKINDDLAFSTRFDGVIYQRYARGKGQSSGKILYRRKMLDMKMLKRAMVTAVIHMYDELMDENCCLGWHQQSPSLFFKDYIEPIYRNISSKLDQNQKFKPKQPDTIDLSTIPVLQQTINSTLTVIDPHKKISMRPRKRYENSGQIFATKSARRVRAVSSNYGIN